MPAFWKSEKKRKRKQTDLRGLPPTLWLFYLGVLSMSLTGLTFSRYSTVIRGTISVKVADAYQAKFLDDNGEELASRRVYDGQRLAEEEVPEGNDCVETGGGGIAVLALPDRSEEDGGRDIIITKRFLGWSLDGETVIDPTEIIVNGDLRFYAVYDITEEWVRKATPSNATPSNATPSETTSPGATPSDTTPPSNAPPPAKPSGTGMDQTVVPETGTAPDTMENTGSADGGGDKDEGLNNNVVIASPSDALLKQ